jgi:SPP1 family phage portal protein
MDNIIEIINIDLRKKAGKYIARNYYYYKPKIEQKEVNTHSGGKVHTIKLDTNCYLYTNYFKMLVNQKSDFLLAKEPELKIANSDITVATITDMLEEGLLNASLDTAAWLHFYVENNKLDWIFVHDSEIIPIYDKYNKNIIEIIRYYRIDEDNYRIETWTTKGVKIETIDKDKIINSNNVEPWTPQKVNFKNIEKDKIIINDILYHYEEITYYQGEIENIEGKNLPFIPFIPLFNNKAKKSDLDGIQDLLDMYNSINSGFVDNINLFQEAIVKLKGFTGDTEELETIRKNMQKYKMVGIPQGGGDNADMEYMGIEIPVEARKVILEILKENIFKVGQGLDPDRLASESHITNGVIKARYSQLDMKANRTQKQLKIFYEKFVDCVNQFNNSGLDKEITFNRSMIFNESESIDNCLKSMNLLDQETILDNHPWVTDSKKVMEKINKEKEENIKRQQELIDVNMKTNDLR